jgi:uncharacterized protein YndB with AHSA1/START domain
LRTTIEVTIEVEIMRPRQFVWDFLADPSNYPRWLEQWRAARVVGDGEPGQGTVVEYTRKDGRVGTFEFVMWAAPRRAAWDGLPLRSRGGAVRPGGYHALSELGAGGTLVTMAFRPELSGALVLMKPYLARRLRRQLTLDVQKLKSLVETGA